MLSISKDTICALSTANGLGAIAVIRVSGSDAFDIVSEVFAKKLSELPSHTAHFGTVRNDQNQVIDEVLVTVLKEGRSFTGEATVEIACHGSVFIQNEIIQLLLKKGCRLAEPGEFTMRAYFNGKMDLSQAEAIADLIASNSHKMHEIAMNQMRGGYSDAIQDLKQKLMDFASLIELELDFSEEDVEFASRSELNALVTELTEKLTKLTSSFKFGNAIKLGVNTVLAGRPNAGKSTLLNALLQEERAIVSSIAGTTRDVISEQLVIDGILFRLIDTAGIRDAVDEIEKMGVERTKNEIERSNILLYVFDVNELSADEVLKDISSFMHTNTEVIVVANKVDLNPDFDLKKIEEKVKIVAISAAHEQGIEELKHQLSQGVKNNTSESDIIVVNARHYEAFDKALMDMYQVKSGLEQQVAGDLLAMDIRSAIRNLSSITGEISTDDLLGNIFANFCIGK